MIGRSKFAYEVYGGAVNIASLMERTGVAGRVQVSLDVYNKVKNLFSFEERIVDLKGKGLQKAFIIASKAPAVMIVENIQEYEI